MPTPSFAIALVVVVAAAEVAPGQPCATALNRSTDLSMILEDRNTPHKPSVLDLQADSAAGLARLKSWILNVLPRWERNRLRFDATGDPKCCTARVAVALPSPLDSQLLRLIRAVATSDPTVIRAIGPRAFPKAYMGTATGRQIPVEEIAGSAMMVSRKMGMRGYTLVSENYEPRVGLVYCHLPRHLILLAQDQDSAEAAQALAHELAHVRFAQMGQDLGHDAPNVNQLTFAAEAQVAAAQLLAWRCAAPERAEAPVFAEGSERGWVEPPALRTGRPNDLAALLDTGSAPVRPSTLSVVADSRASLHETKTLIRRALPRRDRRHVRFIPVSNAPCCQAWVNVDSPTRGDSQMLWLLRAVATSEPSEIRLADPGMPQRAFIGTPSGGLMAFADFTCAPLMVSRRRGLRGITLLAAGRQPSPGLVYAPGPRHVLLVAKDQNQNEGARTLARLFVQLRIAQMGLDPRHGSTFVEHTTAAVDSLVAAIQFAEEGTAGAADVPGENSEEFAEETRESAYREPAMVATRLCRHALMAIAGPPARYATVNPIPAR